MTLEATTRAVNVTMGQARKDAAADLQRHRDAALTAGQEKASRFSSTARRPAGQSTQARYDPAARLLREWYITVYTEASEANLAGRSLALDVDAVERTATHVGSIRAGTIRTGTDPTGPLRATALVWRVARDDAATATVAMLRDLREGVPERAGGSVARSTDLDATRAAVLRHWYQRCYLATVVAQMGLQRPLEAVTAGEAGAVAVSVELGQFHRIVGGDGIPLVTAHSTRMTDVDRRLAAGEAGVVPPPFRAAPANANRTLRHQVTHAWSHGSQTTRDAWASAAGIPDVASSTRWGQIPGVEQSRLIAQWLDDHRGQVTTSQAIDRQRLYSPFVGRDDQVSGSPEEAAASMFGHDVHAVPARQRVLEALFPRSTSEPARHQQTPGAATNARSPHGPAPDRDMQRWPPVPNLSVMARPWTSLDVDRMAELYELGMTTTEIGAELGGYPRTVHRRLVAAGVVMRQPGGRRKVSDEELLRLRGEGLLWREVAARVGMAEAAVHGR